MDKQANQNSSAPLIFSNAEFLISAHNPHQLPDDTGAEIAFLGRSNAGKSSTINTLTKQGLARTSKTPGRTQLINVFSLAPNLRLIDLPGYGYANAPKTATKKWQDRTRTYLRNRRSLAGLVLLMDIRRPLQDIDKPWIELCEEIALPCHLVLTKSDKLSKGAAAQTCLNTQRLAQESFIAPLTSQTFSSLKRTGIEALKAWISEKIHEK